MRGERVGGDMHDRALAVLIGFRAGQETLTPCGPKERSATRRVTSSERRKAPAKPSRRRARSRFAPEAAPADRGDADHVRGEERRRLALRLAAMAAGNALQRLAQRGIAGIERQAEQGVRLGDRGEPAGQGRVGALAGEPGQMIGDQGGGGGSGRRALVPAPCLPGSQMARIGAAGRRGERLAGVGEGGVRERVSLGGGQARGGSPNRDVWRSGDLRGALRQGSELLGARPLIHANAIPLRPRSARRQSSVAARTPLDGCASPAGAWCTALGHTSGPECNGSPHRRRCQNGGPQYLPVLGIHDDLHQARGLALFDRSRNVGHGHAADQDRPPAARASASVIPARPRGGSV